MFPAAILAKDSKHIPSFLGGFPKALCWILHNLHTSWQKMPCWVAPCRQTWSPLLSKTSNRVLLLRSFLFPHSWHFRSLVSCTGFRETSFYDALLNETWEAFLPAHKQGNGHVWLTESHATGFPSSHLSRPRPWARGWRKFEIATHWSPMRPKNWALATLDLPQIDLISRATTA